MLLKTVDLMTESDKSILFLYIASWVKERFLPLAE